MSRERLEKADPIEFLLDRKKPLELTKKRQESLKSLRKEMQRTQAPVFTELGKLFGDTPPRQRGTRVRTSSRSLVSPRLVESGPPPQSFPLLPAPPLHRPP